MVHFTFVTPVVHGTRLRWALEYQTERRPSLRDLSPILVAHVPAVGAIVNQRHVSVVLQELIHYLSSFYFTVFLKSNFVVFHCFLLKVNYIQICHGEIR